MKEKRKLICSIVIFLMAVFFRFLLPVYADDAINMGIYDDADLFSAAQESDIGEEIQKVILQTGFDVAVVTTNNAQGKSAQKYADYFYTTKKIGKGDKKSGVLFLIDMDNREIYFYTKGDAMRYFSDERQKKIVDNAYSDVKAQQYARCAQSVIADISYYYSQGTVKKQYFVFGDSFLESGVLTKQEGLISLVVSLFPAFFYRRKVKKGYSMVAQAQKSKQQALTYAAGAGFSFLNQPPRLIDTRVSRHYSPRSRSSSSGSSSGRTTTHRSSGGGRYSGTGRKF